MADPISRLPWRGPGDDRPDLPLPPGKLPLRRRRQLPQAVALRRRLRRAVPRLRRPRPGRPARADVLGDRRPRARRDPREHAVAAARARAARSSASATAAVPAPNLGRANDAGLVDHVATDDVRVRLRVGEGQLGRVDLPDARRQLRLDPQALRRPDPLPRPLRRPRLEARRARGRGRVRRLPPPPHGLELVGGRRPHPRRALGRLEPGRGRERPRAQLRARDLARRRARRARPRRASTSSTRSTSTTAPGSSSTREQERRASQKLPFVSYEYRQPFGTFSGTLPGGDRARRPASGVMEFHDAHW